MPELIPPTARLHAAWLEAHAEWGPGQHEDGFGLHPSDEVDSPAGFAAWLTRLASQPDPAQRAAGHRCLYRWIVEDDRVLGGVARAGEPAGPGQEGSRSPLPLSMDRRRRSRPRRDGAQVRQRRLRPVG